MVIQNYWWILSAQSTTFSAQAVEVPPPIACTRTVFLIGNDKPMRILPYSKIVTIHCAFLCVIPVVFASCVRACVGFIGFGRSALCKAC